MNAMNNTKAIVLKNVYKAFAENTKDQLYVLKDIDLEIERGEFFMFVGPSGSGKSTILRIMSGLENGYRGEVKIDRSKIGFVFQQFALMPWLTVYENVELPLLASNMTESGRQKKVSAELDKLGLLKFADYMPKELSGGMKQRVGIARALVTEPEIIFMDEPFSDLDSFTAEELRADILKIWEERRPTIVMVTHIVEEALELADRIAVLTPRPGRIEKIFVNKLPRPRDLRSPEFFKMEDELYKVIKP